MKYLDFVSLSFFISYATFSSCLDTKFTRSSINKVGLKKKMNDWPCPIAEEIGEHSQPTFTTYCLLYNTKSKFSDSWFYILECCKSRGWMSYWRILFETSKLMGCPYVSYSSFRKPSNSILSFYSEITVRNDWVLSKPILCSK